MPQNDWLSHKALMLVKGVGKTAGDLNSAEPDPIVVDLMSGIITLADDWSPEIAPVKNSGVWADSPISDGRTLLAAPVGNVIEKINILISDNSYLGVMTQLDGLNKMVSDCRDYWQSQYQIDPVYLMWWASCGVGYQYALLYNIELSPEYMAADRPALRVSMTLEREPYWRMGVPPGGNPKIWTYYVNSAHPQFNFSGASLVTGTDHLITQTINNKHEWTPAAYGLQTTPITKNYIDIPAALVPGDAPALVELALITDIGVPGSIYIGRSSKQYSGRGHDGITRYSALTLNVGDGNNVGLAVKTATINFSGVLSNGSAVTYYNGRRTSTGVDGAWTTASQWGGSPPANSVKLDREMFRGTFAVFCRARNASVTPVLTDMRMRLFIEEFEDNAAAQTINSVTLQEVYPQIPVPTFGYDLNPLYMGTVTLPLGSRSVQSPLGYGVQLQEANSNLRITIQQRVDVATANRIFEVVDLIFMPIDEGMSQVNLTYSTAGTIVSTGNSIVDNTGYLSRGAPGQNSVSFITNANSGGVSQETRGQDLTLIPRTAQRLYFMVIDVVTGTFLITPLTTIAVRLNIVPRCAGIRDS